MENQIFIQKKTQLNIWLENILDGVAYVCIKYQKRVDQYVSFMFSNVFLNDSGSITFLLQGKTFPTITWVYVFNWLVSKYFLGQNFIVSIVKVIESDQRMYIFQYTYTFVLKTHTLQAVQNFEWISYIWFTNNTHTHILDSIICMEKVCQQNTHSQNFNSPWIHNS